MNEPKWIKMVRIKGPIPSHAHPDDASAAIRLKGSFHVRLTDGAVITAEARTSKVSTRLRDDSVETGLYTYFEVPFNGMSVIYNLHEVELRDDEVVRCMITPKKTRAA